jgi:transcription antitermination factor NusG
MFGSQQEAVTQAPQLLRPDAQSEDSSGLAQWYAVRTLPRHEKRVRDRIAGRNVECYLPLFQTVHRWKNGCKAKVEMPLFPTYLFVAIEYAHRGRVLDIPGVQSFVGAGRQPLPVPDGEIEKLRSGLPLHNARPHARLTAGQTVQITAGPLAGLSGVLVRQKEGLRVVLSVEMLMQAVAVEVDADDIEAINKVDLAGAN